MSGSEVPAALLDISRSAKDSKLHAKVKFGIALSNPATKLVQVSDNSVHLGLELAVQTVGPVQTSGRETKPLDVQIDFRDGYARGNAQFSPLDVFPVALVPTDLETIQELRPQVLPEAAELNVEKGEKPEDVKPDEVFRKTATFVKAHPDSPLAVEIYSFICKTAADRKLDEAALNAAADEYAAAASAWGPRLALRSRIDVATSLVASNFLPQVAIKQIDLALAQLTEDTIPIWKAELESLRDTAVANQALAQLRKGTDADKAKAAEVLRKRNQNLPYDPIVTYELAHFDDEHGKKETALRGYAKLSVLPLFDEIMNQMWKKENAKHPPLRESAGRLWKETHGGKSDGFDKYLDDVYAESMPKFTGRHVPPRSQDPGNRVVLCELFTGTGCPPCVAADIAFSHLLKTYGPTELIALQYHEHIPQPDPLSNDDSMARFKYYFPEQGGTPTFVVSGMPAQRGGLLHQTPDVYNAIRQMIDHFLARRTSVKIHLKAEQKGSVVAITAEADGAFSTNEPIRLRLALAEERVSARGANGVREHEMVVRAMPGGVEGVGLKDGKLVYHGTVDVKLVKKQLDDYLIALEEQQKSKFPAKPLDLAHLSLVAFVQNDESREIYQAATIPFPTSPAPTPTTGQSQPRKESPAAFVHRTEPLSPQADRRASR